MQYDGQHGRYDSIEDDDEKMLKKLSLFDIISHCEDNRRQQQREEVIIGKNDLFVHDLHVWGVTRLRKRAVRNPRKMATVD